MVNVQIIGSISIYDDESMIFKKKKSFFYYYFRPIHNNNPLQLIINHPFIITIIMRIRPSSSLLNGAGQRHYLHGGIVGNNNIKTRQLGSLGVKSNHVSTPLILLIKYPTTT
jgi:hypothetical protein